MEELNTQQAADLLNVSHPFPVSLIDHGEISCHVVDGLRTILAGELVAYKAKRDAEGKAAMEELAAQAQELNMGY